MFSSNLIGIFFKEKFRALAILAHILADDVQAHLHIRLALDSNDEIEILAAVKAARKFIPCSKYDEEKVFIVINVIILEHLQCLLVLNLFR